MHFFHSTVVNSITYISATVNYCYAVNSLTKVFIRENVEIFKGIMFSLLESWLYKYVGYQIVQLYDMACRGSLMIFWLSLIFNL